MRQKKHTKNLKKCECGVCRERVGRKGRGERGGKENVSRGNPASPLYMVALSNACVCGLRESYHWNSACCLCQSHPRAFTFRGERDAHCSLLLNCCSIHSLVTDFGRSRLKPKYREIVKFDNTPIARDMPNNTV